MKVTSEEMESRQIKLSIEVEKSELDKYLEKAYQHLVNRISVPGFRKGKTPKNVLQNLIGKDALLQEALEDMIPEIYSKAVEDYKIEAVAPPKIEITKTDPVIFNAIVPLKPEIVLGEYKDIRIDYKLAEVNPTEVDAVLEQLRYQQSTLIPSDIPADYGDIVTMDVEGEEQGTSLPLRKDLVYELIRDHQLPLPGFVDNIIAINKNQEKSFNISYPADYAVKDLAGKEFSFKVKISEIKKRELPELNDEFAKSLNSENMATLKDSIRSQLEIRAEQITKTEYENKMMEKIVEIGKVEFPPALIELEIENIIDEESRNFPDGLQGFEKYLKNINKSMEIHREELFETAKQKVIKSLILAKVSEAENITIEQAEIDNEIEKIVNQSDSQKENMRKLFELQKPRNSIEQFLVRQKTVKYLEQIFRGSTN
jgi:trigger factor